MDDNNSSKVYLSVFPTRQGQISWKTTKKALLPHLLPLNSLVLLRNMGDTHFFFESWKYFRNFPQSWNFARRVSPHENITKTLKIKQIQVFKLSYNIYLYHSFSFKITVHPKCIASQHLSFKLKKIQNA